MPKVLVAGENGVSRERGRQDRLLEHRAAPGILGDAAARASCCAAATAARTSRATRSRGRLMKNPPFVAYLRAGDEQRHQRRRADCISSMGCRRPPPKDPARPELSSREHRAVALDFKSTRDAAVQRLIVEKELGADNVVTTGYVGSRGDRVTERRRCRTWPAPSGPGAIQQRRATYSVLPNVSSLTVGSSIYTNRYDALQLVFQRRLHQGLTVNTHFRLAHGTLTTFAPWDPKIIEHLRRGSGRPPSVGVPGQLRVAVGADGDRVGWRCARRMATQCCGELADGRPLWRHQLDGACKYRRYRPAESHWRSGVAEERAHTPAMVQHGGLPGAACLYRGQLAADCAARSVATSPGPGVVQGVEAARARRTLQLRYEVYNVTNTPSFQNPVNHARERELRLAHDHGPCDSAADAVRGEAVVLKDYSIGRLDASSDGQFFS